MKPQEKIAIDNLRMEGISPGDIALRLHLSPNTVRSHIRRHPEISGAKLCANCGVPIALTSGRKPKRFCSDACRMAWWNSHPEAVHRKSFYTLVCTRCGKEYQSYGNQERKYCSRACYLAFRRSVPSDKPDALPHLAGTAGEPNATG